MFVVSVHLDNTRLIIKHKQKTSNRPTVNDGYSSSLTSFFPLFKIELGWRFRKLKRHLKCGGGGEMPDRVPELT